MPKTAREILEDILNEKDINWNYDYTADNAIARLSYFAEEILKSKDFLEALARERFEIVYTLTADGINAYRKAKIKVKE